MRRQIPGSMALAVLLVLGAGGGAHAQEATNRQPARQGQPRVQAMARNQTALIPLEVMKGYLRLTDEQVAKIKPVQEKARALLNDLRTQITGADREKLREVLANYRTSMEQFDKEVEAALTEEQRKKVPDMKRDMQLFNSVGLPPAIIADLNLTEEQKKQLTTIAQEAQARRSALTPQERREKGREISQEARTKAMEVLNAEQKAKVENFRRRNQERQEENPPAL